MERVITNRFAGRFLHPSIESRSQRLAFVLDRKIDQRCCPAESRCTRASLEVIRARGPAEWHVEVSMHVDSAGEHILTGRIDYFPRVLARKALADGGDFSLVDRDVAGVSVRCGGYEAIHDDSVKAHGCVSPPRAQPRFYAKLPNLRGSISPAS